MDDGLSGLADLADLCQQMRELRIAQFDQPQFDQKFSALQNCSILVSLSINLTPVQ